MLFKHLVRNSAVALLATICIGHAQASTIVLNLSGTASDLIPGTGGVYDTHYAVLSGIDVPITVNTGDTINTTVTFDGDVTIPVGSGHTDILQFLFGSFTPGDVLTFGDFNFYEGGVLQATLNGDAGTSNQIANYALLFPGDSPIMFDSYTNDFTVTIAGAGTATVDSAAFRYSVAAAVAAVPEPATWAMFLLGFGAIGFTLRGARRAKAVAATA